MPIADNQDTVQDQTAEPLSEHLTEGINFDFIGDYRAT